MESAMDMCKEKLFSISNQIKNESIVFLVGPPRSGTTLLYKTIQQHSSFRLRNQENGMNLAESKVFLNPENSYLAEKGSENCAFLYMGRDEEQYDSFLKTTNLVRSWQQSVFLKDYWPPIKQKLQAGSLTSYKAAFHHYLLRSFFFFALKAKGAKRLVEKTPNHIYFLSEILYTFPNAQIVCILRHPIDIYSSYKRRLQVELKNGVTDQDHLRWLKITPGDFCKRYEQVVTISLNNPWSSTGNFQWFKYEELIENPVEQLKKVLHFLSEDYEGCNIQAKKVEGSSLVDPYLAGGIVKQTKNWEDFLDKDDAVFIEDRLEGVCEALGYSRYT
jgi:Sulfotransferase family